MNNIYFPKINLIAILITGVCLIPAKSNAQFDCDSYTQSPAKENIMHEYSYTNIGNNYNIIQGENLFTFINEKKEVYLVNLVLEELYIQKYDENLQFIISNIVPVSMEKSRSYLEVIQLGDHIYLFYTEKLETAGANKKYKLMAQEIDASTLVLSEEKIVLLDGDVEFESGYDMPGAHFINTNMSLVLSENKKFLGLLLFRNLKTDMAEFNYKVFTSDLNLSYSGNITPEYDPDYVKSITAIVNNVGSFAAGITVTKVKKVSAANYVTNYIYSTDNNNKIYTNIMENEIGYSKEFRLFTLDDQLFADLEWHNYDEKKLMKNIKKLYIIDYKSGEKVDEISNMPFDYLLESERKNYSRLEFDDYSPLSYRFTLASIQQDNNGNVYLVYLEYLQVLIKETTFAIKIFVKLDENFKTKWGHMFYYSYAEGTNLVVDGEKVHAYGVSHAKMSSASTIEMNIGYEEHKNAAKEEYLYDITFSEDGQFEIKEFVPKCNEKYQKLNLVTGGYFQEHNTFLYYGFTEEKGHPGYLVKFNY